VTLKRPRKATGTPLEASPGPALASVKPVEAQGLNGGSAPAFVLRRPQYKPNGNYALKDPELALALAERLAAGQGVKAIAKALNVSPGLVRGVRDRLVSEGKLAPLKERLATKLEHAAETAVEQYLDALDAGEVNPRDMMLAACQATDKALLLRGEANARLEIRQGQPTIDSVNRKLKELLDSLPPLDAEVIESKPQVDKAGGGGETGGERSMA
jgi:hypothetical protein